MTDDNLDPVLQDLRQARPDASPSTSVRNHHRAELDDALHSMTRGRRFMPWIAAAAAATVAVGGLSLVLTDTSDDQVATGDQVTTSAPASPVTEPAGPPLESTACGGPLPFDMPVGEAFTGPTMGPAAGAEPPTSEDQLIAHWTSGTTQIEVRWPATQHLDRGPIHLSAVDRTRPDLGIQVQRGQHSAHDGLGTTYGLVERPRDTYRMAVSAHPAMDGVPENLEPTPPEELWGKGMCGAVEITLQASDAEGDVLPEAEAFYDRLIAPGGPLFPDMSTDEPLVTSRTSSDVLEPVTPCDGNPGNPTTTDAIDVTATFPSPDAALAAHATTSVLVSDDGPFGRPLTTPIGPTSGYTSISLPDGTVAYRFPAITAYFIAEQLDDGWAITRYKGPTC